MIGEINDVECTVTDVIYVQILKLEVALQMVADERAKHHGRGFLN